MGKKNKGRKIVVTAAQDLDSFKVAAATTAEPSKAPGDTTSKAAAGEDERVTNSSESQMKAIIQRIKKDEHRQSLKDLANHFFYLDNKLVEFYSGSCDESQFTQQERSEILEEEVFLFYIRQLTSEIEYVVNLPFAHFWAEITKDN